jgi:hypothetical protein
LTDDVYLANEGANGPGAYALKLMDTRTGTTSSIFDDAFTTYALDSSTNTILLHSYPFFYPEREPGLYMVQVDEPSSITPIMSPGDYFVRYLGLDQFPFMVYSDEGGTVLVGSNGSSKPLTATAYQAEGAPTANLLALFNARDENGLWIYDLDREEYTNGTTSAVQSVKWRSDSGAIFYLSGHELHVYDLGTGENMLIYAWPGSPVINTDFSWVTLP